MENRHARKNLMFLFSGQGSTGHYKRALLYQHYMWLTNKILRSWSIIIMTQNAKIPAPLTRNNSWNFPKMSRLLIKVIIMSVTNTRKSLYRQNMCFNIKILSSWIIVCLRIKFKNLSRSLRSLVIVYKHV